VVRQKNFIPWNNLYKKADTANEDYGETRKRLSQSSSAHFSENAVIEGPKFQENAVIGGAKFQENAVIGGTKFQENAVSFVLIVIFASE
jgi:hypothetical protein